MEVLVWMLAVVAAAVGILLAWPLSYACWGRWYNGPAYEVSIDYFLFQLRRSFHCGTCCQRIQFLCWTRTQKPKTEPSQRKNAQKKSKAKDAGGALSVLRIGQGFTREDLEHLLRLLRDLVTYVRPDTGQIRFDLGFEEPEYNGAAVGLYYGARSLWREVPVTLTIHWEEVCLDIEAEAAGRVRPVQIVLLFGRYVLCRRGLALLRRTWRHAR